MEFNIINSGKKITGFLDFYIIWGLVLLADKINWSGSYSALMKYRLHAVNPKSKEEVIILKSYLKMFKVEIQEKIFDENFDIYLKIKKLKHKQPKNIIYINKVEQLLSDYKKYIDMALDAIFENVKLEKLYGLMGKPVNSIIGVFGNTTIIGGVPDTEADIANVSDSFIFEEEALVLSNEIKDYFKIYSLEDSVKVINYEEKAMLKVPLLKIFSPEQLDENHIKIVRNELNNYFQEVSPDLISLKKSLLKTFFGEESFETCREEILLNILPKVKKYQDVINENVFIQMLKNSTDNGLTYEIFLCVTSIRNVIDYMIDLDLLGSYSKEYIEEELSGNGISFDNTTVVYFVEIKNKEGINVYNHL